MRRKICTYFLLLVLTIQILPIQQMGSLLFSNQFTEELPHSVDTDKNCCKQAALKSDYLSTPSFSLVSAFINSSSQYLHFADDIPQNHADDIHVPPPNC